MTWLNSVYSDGSTNFITPEYPRQGQKVSIKLRLYRNNPVTKVLLRTAPEGEEVLNEMHVCKEDDTFIWYTIKEHIHNTVFAYRFKLLTTEGKYWYNNIGMQRTTPLDVHDFRIITNFTPPSWLHERVFYQIFPDRFACKNEPVIPKYTYLGHKPIRKQWHEKPGEYHQTYCMDFFGGNIAGVFSKISHLQNLGINALYFNPIFHAPSNHRYDVQDYFKIDPIFGDNSSFAILVKRLQQSNIKVILDGVFNHSGMACRWFNKAKYYDEQGAYQSQQSKYTTFYCFIKHPRKYHSWQGVDTLPKFNYACGKLRDMIYRRADSVMQYWLKEPYSIDGWRIDAANMLGRSPGCEDYLPIWRELRQIIKDKYPESYLLGEHFFDPSDLLQGNALDAAMNYQGFTFPVRKWLTENFATQDLEEQLRTFRSTVSWQVILSQYNLLNSHDIPRLSFLLSCKSLQKLACAFLFTYPGVPAILYGEEIGLSGGESCESSRLPMPWQEKDWDSELLEFYRKLIKFRKNSIVLQKGGFKTLHVAKDIFGYARFLDGKTIIVILNRGAMSNINLNLKPIAISANSAIRSWDNNENLHCDDNSCLQVTIPSRNYFMGIIE
ncbi:alpha-amylase family glycosyl hydrolase [Candidatus Uabimicrobium amorphum]|uniref:Alpha-glycosidase n=1 Tax=Uabimicrobium amorphum TaxID=2596890 RepID=A0A5S9F4N6_UABAM|nr:alpha-amylase family glycosyl hydrolase [Candidatus Uabimicrobium amorphum]BBM84789.1 alpha-glycosidase [Candidatus Uabimicrobium amorphum]